MRIPGGPKAIAQGAASTIQMTDAVLEKLSGRKSHTQRALEHVHA
jgi:hypothetical protein